MEHQILIFVNPYSLLENLSPHLVQSVLDCCYEVFFLSSLENLAK